MNKIEEKLTEIKKRNKIGLMTHIVIGYPSLEETAPLVHAMADAGADFVELQIPFTDPLADGPTIMKACEVSLANGTTVKDAFRIMKELSSQVHIPLLFMAYYNTVFRYGAKKFCKDAKQAGASGLIVPDMPIDEEAHEHFYQFAKKFGLFVIKVVSPASTEERLKKNAAGASGFVYCTARQGITGAKKQLDPFVSSHLTNVKNIFSIPVAVGFGISQKEHIKALQGASDIAVVGSALIEKLNKVRKKDRIKVIKQLIKDLSIE